MWEFIKLNLMLIIAIVCGPFFAVLLSFYVDIISLSQEYKFLQYINYDWKLLIVFGIFWIGIYFSLAFWSGLKRLIYKAPKLDWWQTETFYQIYVKSFFDSNGDGVGDLKGVLQKLDYVQSLGAKTILLNPIYPSGGKNGGYDVTSYIEIDPVYGSIKDFDELVDEVHRRDMHILLDFVPYHTSNSHQWFVESCKDEPNNRFKDFFIWQRSKDSQTPPNNWKSVFGGPAWTYVESRKAWYFHQFLPEQPTLNLRSAEVKAELEAVVTFWLERKRIDGFLLNAVENFHFAPNLENTDSDLKHVQTMNQSATFDLLNEWRTLLTNLSKRTKSNKVLIVETSSGVNQLGKYYTHENRKRAHLVINKQFCLLNRKSVEDHTVAFKPTNLKALIEEHKTHLPKCCWSSWQLGNNSISRVASRVGIENANLANALNLLLGGTAIIYYGEEIGMEDLPKECLKFEECQDDIAKIKGTIAKKIIEQKEPSGFSAYSRDFERTPMQWDNSDFAGFSKSNRSWLPVSPNFKDLNVKAQSEQKKSTLALFRELVELRSHPSFQYGSIKMITINEQIFSFLRKAFGCDVYLVCMNISDTNANVNLLVSNEIAPRAYVALYIPGTLYTESGGNSAEDIDLDAKYKLKAPVLTKNVFLKPRDCLILTWPTSD